MPTNGKGTLLVPIDTIQRGDDFITIRYPNLAVTLPNHRIAELIKKRKRKNK
jgi:hypothetical protein